MLKLAFVAGLSVFFPLLFLFVVVAVWADLGKVLFEIGLKSTDILFCCYYCRYYCSRLSCCLVWIGIAKDSSRSRFALQST